MVELYSDLPFILIGDSGQRDPEIHAEIAEMYPRRTKAIYIRNVSRNQNRLDEVEKLAQSADASGTPLFLAVDSFTMAEHTSEQGFITAQAVRSVMARRKSTKTIRNFGVAAR